MSSGVASAGVEYSHVVMGQLTPGMVFHEVLKVRARKKFDLAEEQGLDLAEVVRVLAGKGLDLAEVLILQKSWS